MSQEPMSHNAKTTELEIRQALPSDAAAIHALMRPFVAQRLLLDRTEAEVIELTRHGFVAIASIDSGADGSETSQQCVGFSAVEIYSEKLAELQCLAVHADYQRDGVGRKLVERCVRRAKDLNRDGDPSDQFIGRLPAFLWVRLFASGSEKGTFLSTAATPRRRLMHRFSSFVASVIQHKPRRYARSATHSIAPVCPRLNEIRMMGVIRCSKTCLKCHDARRSELLGAFTYTLILTH